MRLAFWRRSPPPSLVLVLGVRAVIVGLYASPAIVLAILESRRSARLQATADRAAAAMESLANSLRSQGVGQGDRRREQPVEEASAS